MTPRSSTGVPASAPTRSVRRIDTRMSACLRQRHVRRVGSVGLSSSVGSSPWVQTLAPPAPVLSSTPSTGPIAWSWKPAAKMSVAE